MNPKKDDFGMKFFNEDGDRIKSPTQIRKETRQATAKDLKAKLLKEGWLSEGKINFEISLEAFNKIFEEAVR